jgi:hypothetical protein
MSFKLRGLTGQKVVRARGKRPTNPEADREARAVRFEEAGGTKVFMDQGPSSLAPPADYQPSSDTDRAGPRSLI